MLFEDLGTPWSAQTQRLQGTALPARAWYSPAMRHIPLEEAVLAVRSTSRDASSGSRRGRTASATGLRGAAEVAKPVAQASVSPRAAVVGNTSVFMNLRAGSRYTLVRCVPASARDAGPGKTRENCACCI